MPLKQVADRKCVHHSQDANVEPEHALRTHSAGWPIEDDEFAA